MNIKQCGKMRRLTKGAVAERANKGVGGEKIVSGTILQYAMSIDMYYRNISVSFHKGVNFDGRFPILI